MLVVTEAEKYKKPQEINCYEDKQVYLQRENMELRNQLFVKDQLAPITAQLASIQCNMLRRPDVYGLGTSCNTIFTPPLNVAGGCGCGTVI